METDGSSRVVETRRGSPRWREGALAAALFAGTAALYAQVARLPFLAYDDNRYVTDNPQLRLGLSWEGVKWAFSTVYFSNWHPLTWLSYLADVQLFGVDPGAFHLENALLHGLNAMLVFLVLRALTGALGRSLVVAALFAVHPLHVESVAWIAERKDVLSTLFGLLAIGAWARYARRPSAGWYAAVVAAFAASLLSKPMLVTLPFLLLLLDVWPLGRAPGFVPADPSRAGAPASWGRLALEKAPLLALSIASSIVSVVAQRAGGAVQALDAIGLGARVSNALLSYVAYAWKTIWPARLAAFYPLPADIPTWQTAAAALIVAFATVGALAAVRRAPWLSVGWLWFAGTLVPVIGLVQVGAQGMADRYAYLPMTGLLVAVVWGADALRRRAESRVPSSAVAGGVVVVLAVLAALTLRQIALWRDHEALFGHALEVVGDDVRIRGLLAQGLRSEGKPERALPHAEAAVRIAPASGRSWATLGLVLRDLHRPAEAYAALARATEIAPDLGLAWTLLGQTAAELGRGDEAELALRRATALTPEDAHAWNELGLVLAATGRADEAHAAYRRAVAVNPRSAPAWTNLAILCQRTGRADEAAEAFTAAVRAEPANPIFWRNLGVFEAKLGRPAEAARALREALARGPASVELLRRLADAELASGESGAALATAARLDALAPGAGDEVRARAGAGR